MGDHAMVVEHLSVVGGDHPERVVQLPRSFECFEDAPDLGIDVGQGILVAVDGGLVVFLWIAE